MIRAIAKRALPRKYKFPKSITTFDKVWYVDSSITCVTTMNPPILTSAIVLVQTAYRDKSSTGITDNTEPFIATLTQPIVAGVLR